MGMTPLCRCWRRVKPISRACGFTCAMIGHSADRVRPARCSIIRAIAPAFTRKPISPTTAAYSRLMRMAVTTSSMSRTDLPARSLRRRAGLMGDENSSSWPILHATPNAKLRVRRPPSSPQWRWLRCSGSTRCSRLSGASTVGRLPNAWRHASNSAPRWSPSWRVGCAPNAPSCRVTTMSLRRWTTC